MENNTVNNVVSLKDLFYRRVFQIPDYQRSYSWEHQQVKEFLQDLEFLPSDKHHYTGTIVIHQPDTVADLMDEDGNSYDRVDIVDGQQRLTTIILLLDGIRRHLKKHSKQAKKLSHGIRKNYISACDLNGQPLYRLSLNSDTDFFSEKAFYLTSLVWKEPRLPHTFGSLPRNARSAVSCMRLRIRETAIPKLR